MGLLDAIMQSGERVKRNVRGLLGDPYGYMSQQVANATEDMKAYSDLVNRSNQRARMEVKGIDAMTGSPPIKWNPGDDKKLFDQSMQVVGMAPVGMIAYHGSPHKFSKFDMSKIGTGEGAQAFGHGLYFAESPGVAKSYMNAGQSVVPQEVGYAGKNADQWYNFWSNKMSRNPRDEQAKAATYFWERIASRQHPQTAINMALDEGADWPELAKFAKQFDVNKFTGVPPSHLYKVDIPDEAIPRMLDWDKPLSEQPANVRDFFVNRGYGDDLNIPSWMRNEGDPDAVSAILKETGIPGIRYLDGNSRGAGQGTSNFVLFDDQLPRILEVNGKPTGLLPWKPQEWRGLLGGQ